MQRPVSTPGRPLNATERDSATPSPLLSTRRINSPTELKKLGLFGSTGLLVATSTDPSDRTCIPYGKFKPDANVVILKSSGLTPGPPMFRAWAAPGVPMMSPKAATRARDNHHTAHIRPLIQPRHLST